MRPTDCGVLAQVAEPLGEVVERRDRRRLQPPLGPAPGSASASTRRRARPHAGSRAWSCRRSRSAGPPGCTGRGSIVLPVASKCGRVTRTLSPVHAAAHRGDRLVGEVVALLEVDAERGELTREVARAHADDDPAARQRVERRDRLRGEERVAVREDQQVRLQPDPRRRRGREARARRTGRGSWCPPVASQRSAGNGWSVTNTASNPASSAATDSSAIASAPDSSSNAVDPVRGESEATASSSAPLTAGARRCARRDARSPATSTPRLGGELERDPQVLLGDRDQRLEVGRRTRASPPSDLEQVAHHRAQRPGVLEDALRRSSRSTSAAVGEPRPSCAASIVT